MKIGFAVPVAGSWATPENQAHIARRAEDLGYDSLWTFQRLLFPADPQSPRWIDAYRSVQDPLITLAYLAGQTSRVRLGVAVLNMPFFSPAVLAKQASTLDIVSGGRLDIGLGLGWAPEEYAAAGATFGRRGRQSEEFIRCLQALWTQDVVDFHGEFYDVPAARMDPKPLQRPHPPVLLGASAEPALRRAGQLTAGWVSSSGADLSRIGEPIRAVRDAARDAGRDPGELRFVCRGVVRVRTGGEHSRRPLTGSMGEIRGDIEYLRDQGVTEFFIDLNYDPQVASLDADPAAACRQAEQTLEAFAP